MSKVARRKQLLGATTASIPGVIPDDAATYTSSPTGTGPTSPLLAPDGQPVRTLNVPVPYLLTMTYTGQRLLLTAKDGLYIVNALTGATQLATLPPEDKSRAFWEPLPSPATDELWLFGHGANRIERFTMPPLN